MSSLVCTSTAGTTVTPEFLSRTQREGNVTYGVVIRDRDKVQPRQSRLPHDRDGRHLLLGAGRERGMDVQIVAVSHSFSARKRLLTLVFCG